MIVWTDPFPNVCVPMITARPWSCSAPATISLALAVPRFTRTIIGYGGSVSFSCARSTSTFFRPRPAVVTMTPEVRNTSEMRTAWSSRPPGLFRRSSTRPRSCPWAAARASSSAFKRLRSVRSWNVRMRTYA